MDDAQAMRGGFLLPQPSTPQPLSLPFIVDNPYPSFALIYNVLPGDPSQGWQFYQRDRYGCIH